MTDQSPARKSRLVPALVLVLLTAPVALLVGSRLQWASERSWADATDDAALEAGLRAAADALESSVARVEQARGPERARLHRGAWTRLGKARQRYRPACTARLKLLALEPQLARVIRGNPTHQAREDYGELVAMATRLSGDREQPFKALAANLERAGRQLARLKRVRDRLAALAEGD